MALEVLVVDDEADIRELVSGVLEDEGYVVRTAADRLVSDGYLLALDAGTADFMMLGQLRVAAERLPASRLPAAMEALLRTDEAIKSASGSSRVQLERLVVELCGTRARGRASGGWRPGPSLGRR